MKELLTIYIRENSLSIQKLQEQRAAENWNELKRAAHKLKSSLALIGLNDARAQAEELEHYAGDDPAKTKKFIEDLTSTLKQVIVEMEIKLKELS